MESMDEVYSELVRFSEVLAEFNDHLLRQLKDLSRCHDNVSPLWQDEMRRTYDSVYSHLHEKITNYVEKDGPDYLHFLGEKVSYAKEYLYE